MVETAPHLERAAMETTLSRGMSIQVEHIAADTQPKIQPIQRQNSTALRAQFADALQAHFEGNKDAERTEPSHNPMASTHRRSSSLRYRGVTKHKRTQRYEAHIWECKKQIYLGGFDSETLAAKSHDIMALRCKGSSSDILNFCADDYQDLLPLLERLSREDIIVALRNYSKSQTALRLPHASSHLSVRSGGVNKASSLNTPRTRKPPMPMTRRLSIVTPRRRRRRSTIDDDDEDVSDNDEQYGYRAQGRDGYMGFPRYQQQTPDDLDFDELVARFNTGSNNNLHLQRQQYLNSHPAVSYGYNVGDSLGGVMGPPLFSPGRVRTSNRGRPAQCPGAIPGQFSAFGGGIDGQQPGSPGSPVFQASMHTLHNAPVQTPTAAGASGIDTFDDVNLNAVLSQLTMHKMGEGGDQSLTYSADDENYLFESLPMDATHTALEHLSGVVLYQNTPPSTPKKAAIGARDGSRSDNSLDSLLAPAPSSEGPGAPKSSEFFSPFAVAADVPLF